MAWENFQSRDGIYAVNWQGVGRIIRSYVRSCATLANAKVNEEFHWIGPTLHTLDVDWDQVRRQTDSESEYRLADLYQAMHYDTPLQLGRLVHWVEQTRLNNARFHKVMQDAQKQTMANIDKSVERAEVGLKFSRFARDFSAEFLMVSATLITGGGAAAVVGAGSLSGGAAVAAAGTVVAVGAGLKATAKAEDDSKATKGTIAATFAAEFVAGVIDLGVGKVIDGAAAKAAEEAFAKAVGSEAARELEKEAAKKGTKLALAVLWNQVKGVTVEPGKAVVEGETIQKGLLTGGLKSIGGIQGEIVKYLVLDDEEFPALAAIADTTISLTADGASDSFTESSNEKNNGAGQTQRPKIVKPATDRHALLDALAYDRQMVNKMALRKVGPARVPHAPSWTHVRSAAGFQH